QCGERGDEGIEHPRQLLESGEEEAGDDADRRPEDEAEERLVERHRDVKEDLAAADPLDEVHHDAAGARHPEGVDDPEPGGRLPSARPEDEQPEAPDIRPRLSAPAGSWMAHRPHLPPSGGSSAPRTTT